MGGLVKSGSPKEVVFVYLFRIYSSLLVNEGMRNSVERRHVVLAISGVSSEPCEKTGED